MTHPSHPLARPKPRTPPQRGQGARWLSAVAFTLKHDTDAHRPLALEAHYMHGAAPLASQRNRGTRLDELQAHWRLTLVETPSHS